MGRTSYTIELGNEEITFEGPDGLTDKQIENLAAGELKTAKPGHTFRHPVFAGVSKVEAPAPPADASSAGGSFGRGAMHGGYFNWDDEIGSGIDAAIPGMAELDNLLLGSHQQGPISGKEGFWNRFNANMAEYQAQNKVDKTLHPTAQALGEVTGAVGTSLAPMGAIARAVPEAMAAKTAAHPILAAMGVGGAGGGVSGAGAGAGNRAQSGAMGLATGTALGGAFGAGAKLLPAIAQYGKVIFNKGVNSEAVRQMVKTLHRAGFDVVSPSGVQKLKAALSEYTGKPVSLADLGSALRSRAGVGLRSPSDVQQASIDAVRSRQAGQIQRLSDDVRATVSPRTDVHALDEQLLAQRASEAQRLREAAMFEDGAVPPPPTRPQIAVSGPADAGVKRTMGLDVPDTFAPVPATAPVPTTGRVSRMADDPVINNLINTPMGMKARDAAIAESMGERDLLAAQGQSIDHLPDLEAGKTLDVRTLDTMKRFLDQQVSKLYRGNTETFTTGQLQQVKMLRDGIRDRLKSNVPEYADYLDTYKGSSEMIDSLAEGQNYSKLPEEAIAAGQADRSVAGQELYRVGAARNILDIIRSTKITGNPASRILNSPESQAQLAATGVAPADMTRLTRSVEQERTMNQLPQELAGSDTNRRQIAQADADAGANVSLPYNVGSRTGWFGAAIRTALNHASVARNAAVNEKVLPQLLETNPKAIEGIINNLTQQGNIAAARALRRAQRARQTGLISSNIIGGPVSLPEGEY